MEGRAWGVGEGRGVWGRGEGRGVRGKGRGSWVGLLDSLECDTRGS